MRRLAAPLRRRSSGGSDDDHRGWADSGSAMVLVMVLMLVVAAIAVGLAAAVTQRSVPTLALQKRTQTIAAAEAGLDAGVARLRTAAAAPDVAGRVFGAPSALPCTLSGSVAGAVDGLGYSVSVVYFGAGDDPKGRSAQWRSVHQLACTADRGPVDASGRTTTPGYALLISQGSGQALAGADGADGAAIGNRTLEAVYAFKVTNANLPGGLMLTYGQGYCVQVDSAATNSLLHYVAASSCSHSSSLQLFQWDPDYRIRLSSTTAPGATPLCITGVFSGGADATLQECRADRYDQLFSYAGAHFEGQNSSNTGGSGRCLWSGTESTTLAGRSLQSGAGCRSSDDPRNSWSPEPRFGAGGASHATNQVVNYQQFGRCLDITDEDVNADFLILYPCKQDPTGHGGFLWNHKIYYSATTTGAQWVYVYDRWGAQQCLTAPPAGQAQPAWPRLWPCAPGHQDQLWKRTEAVPGSYAASYTFTDAFGRCLGVGPLRPAQQDWSTTTVETCSGGAAQKWNAPPEAAAAGVTSLREVPRGP